MIFLKIYRPPFLRLLLYPVFACILLTIPFSCGSFEHLTEVRMEFPRAHICGECHVEIYKEWSSSPHAKAFVSSFFRDSTNNHGFKDCLGCHSPEPMLTGISPKPRTVFNEEGVTCVSCHLEEGKHAGPFEPSGLVTPHPVTVDSERYRNSLFCGRCHEGTYNQWKKSDTNEKASCQTCHMPEVTRKITQGTGMVSGILVSMEDEHDLKRHTFVTVPVELEKQPIAVKLLRSKSKILLRIKNNIPHSLPTGDFGVRIVTVRVTSCGEPEECFGDWELIQELGTSLASGALKDRLLSLPAGIKKVRIRIIRSGRDGSGAMDIMNVEVPVP